MAQKVVLRIPTMTDDKSKQKAMEAVADIYGIDSIAADLKDKRLKKLGKIDIISVGPAKEEKKPAPAGEKKDDKKEEKKDDKKVDKK
ncbi:nucleolar protein 58-like isoform x1 [Hordeum vulgare]|nr:nucleolar protein 58-like isoform x1 [Hordeum vulgare]